MPGRWTYAAAGAVLAGAAVTAWMLVPRFGAHGGPHAAGAGAPSAAGPLERRGGPLPVGPFHSIRPELTRRASAGDADAAYRLGHVLMLCGRYQPMADGDFATMAARAVGSLRTLLRGGESEETLIIDAAVEAKPQLDDACLGTERMRAKGDVDEAARWMEAAAGAGDPRAKVDFVDAAFMAFPTSAELLDHAGEVARRRDRARTWLLQAHREGNVEAMRGLAKAYAQGTLFPQDHEKALGWLLAYRDAPGDHYAGPAAIALAEYQLRKKLDAAAQARATRFAKSVSVATTRRTP